MGVQNLLRFMKPFIEPIHIKKYSGKRGSMLTHGFTKEVRDIRNRSKAYSCSMELCLDSQSKAARRYLKYFMHHINLLRHHKITPVVVFDGGDIPCKSATEIERHRRREANLAVAKEKLKEGNVGTAIEFFQKAVHITPSMAHQLIQILKSESVEFIVAPYEADAQLAHLNTLDADKGGIAAVITEDSDLIAYGCQAVIFKMDRYGNGEELLLERVFSSASDGLSFRHFDNELFTGMCVLAGCDFLPSIPGIGTKRAYSFVSKYKNLDRVLSALKFDKAGQMPEDYSELFWKAVAVFRHARVYDAGTKVLKHLKPLEQKRLQALNGDLDFLGPELPSSIAAAIAEGRLNPITMEAFNHFPQAESYIDIVHIQPFDHSCEDETQTVSTLGSCITSMVHEFSNGNITCTQQVVDQKKYMKEALALGKLVAPMVQHHVVEREENRRDIPNNNPFKKRKLHSDNVVEKEAGNEVSVLTYVGRHVDIFCSSPESQESVESKPLKKVSVGKEKNLKKLKTKDDCKSIRSDKNGIYKFFERL